MPLDHYVHALTRWWYIIVVLILAAVLGGRALLAATPSATAIATVAVLEPALTKASNGQQAVVTFDSVVNSQTVAERVIKKEGLQLTPEDMQGKITVKLARSLVTNVTSPLYTVEVRDRDPGQAIALTNAVVAEATQVFLQLNTADPQQVEGAFQDQEQQARSDVTSAEDALLQFEDANRAWLLPAQVQAQMSLVDGLRQSQLSANLGQNTLSSADIKTLLTQAQAELDRLRGLDPVYQRLALDVSVATAAVNQYAGHATDLSLTNQTDVLQAALKGEANARTQLTNAQNALTAFEKQNNVYDLNAQMAAELALITDLQRQSLAIAPSSTAISQAITTEDSRLQQMLKLLPEYNRLDTGVTTAQSKLTQLEALKVNTLLGGSITAPVEVKVLDAAAIQPDHITAFVAYVLGPVLGLFVGLAVIYVLAYVDRQPRTIEDVQDLTGVAVLGRVPSAF